jgi:hypothetical protein
MSPEEKDRWLKQERAFRQACRQDTAFGRRYRERQEEKQQAVTEQYRIDTEDDKLE